MGKTTAKIRFDARLLRPAEPKHADWAFAVLPTCASARLPTRAMVSVEGTLAGHPFQTDAARDKSTAMRLINATGSNCTTRKEIAHGAIPPSPHAHVR